VPVGSRQLLLADVRCLQQVELAALRPPRRAFPAGASATAAVVALMFDEMLSYVNVGCARLHPILAQAPISTPSKREVGAAHRQAADAMWAELSCIAQSPLLRPHELTKPSLLVDLDVPGSASSGR
jgi:hypothetical protein